MTPWIRSVSSVVKSVFKNGTICQGQEDSQVPLQFEVRFWLGITICTLIIAIGTVLNALVIYFATQTKLTGAFRNLNTVVKHLAISDLLYGLVGCPFLLVNFRMGKN